MAFSQRFTSCTQRAVHSGVAIRVVDRTARAEFKVEPRQFEGRLLNELDGPLSAQSELYAELYLHAHSPVNVVSLYRSGTRVLELSLYTEENLR